MGTMRDVSILVRTRNGKSTVGTVTIVHWTDRDRTVRALKILGIFWGLAFFSVFLPVAHFFLVPGFLLLGPIMAILVHRQKSVIEKGMAPCPQCHEVLPIAKGTEKWPLDDLCTKCQTHVTVDLKS